jgi:hypothetical protein
VPQPARYAVHKLIVAQERKKTFALKAQKDLEQSFDLQKILEKFDPESLAEAFQDARKKGPGWRQLIRFSAVPSVDIRDCKPAPLV